MTQPIFNRNLLQRHRNRAAQHFHKHDFLKKYANQQIKARLSQMQRAFDTSLELGAHSDTYLENIAKKSILCNLSSQMLHTQALPCVIADDEHLPFAPHSIELLVSTLNIHWVNNVPEFLSTCRGILTPNGVCIMSMLGGQTLHEFRHICSIVEQEHRQGIAPRTAPFIDIKTAGMLLQQAQFDSPITDSETVTVTYDDIYSLLYDIRGMGESNCLTKTPPPLNKEVINHINTLYKEQYGNEDGSINATFDIITLTAIAPNT